MQLQKTVLTLSLGILALYGFSDTPLDSRKSLIGLEHKMLTPFLFEGSQDLYIHTDQTVSLLTYANQHHLGTRYSIQLLHNAQEYQIRDSSKTTLSLANRDQVGLSLNMEKRLNRHEVAARVDLSESMGISLLQLGYAQKWQYYHAYTDLTSSRQAWDIVVEDPNNATVGVAFYKRSSLRVGNEIQSKWGSLSASIAGSVPVTIPTDATGISTELYPYHRGYEIVFKSEEPSILEVELFLNYQLDTLNSDITSEQSSIGKLYAFDKEELSIGLAMKRGQKRVTLSHHKIDTRVSGSVLASYFGDVLTQLSGARYYHQVEVNGSYLAFNYGAVGKLSTLFNYDMDYSIYVGEGQIYSKHYVFQLFNPATDLQIQKLTVHSAVLSDLSLHAERELFEKIYLGMDVDILIPLYIDMEISPERDYDSADIRMGRRLGLRLFYCFD